MFRIIETDNFGGDYPDERFVNLPPCGEKDARKLAKTINSVFCTHPSATRYWRVVPDDYKLQPGFTP